MIEVSDTITDIHIDRNVNNIDNLVINWTFGMTICVQKLHVSNSKVVIDDKCASCLYKMETNFIHCIRYTS